MSLRLVRLVALSRHPLLRRRPMLRDVLVHLADLADDEGLCWPSAAYLRETVGLSRSYVFDAIASLEQGGLLAVAGARKGKRGQVPVRRITVGSLAKGPTLSDGGGPTLSDGGGADALGPGSLQDDPVRDPSSGKPPPPTPTLGPSEPPVPVESDPREGGEFSSRVQRTAAAVVDRYLEDEQRPTDQTVTNGTRAKLEIAVGARLRGPTDKAGLRARAQDILRAWELLRDDEWWAGQPEGKRLACVRLGWLVAEEGRIEARFERAGEAPQWATENTQEGEDE